MAKINWSTHKEIDARETPLTDMQKLEAKFELLKTELAKTKSIIAKAGLK